MNTLTNATPGGDAPKSRFIPAVVMLVACVALIGTGLYKSAVTISIGLYGIYYHYVPILLIGLGIVAGWASYQMFRNKD